MISLAGTPPISSHGLDGTGQKHNPSASQLPPVCLCHGALGKEITSSELGVFKVGKMKSNLEKLVGFICKMPSLYDCLLFSIQSGDPVHNLDFKDHKNTYDKYLTGAYQS